MKRLLVSAITILAFCSNDIYAGEDFYASLGLGCVVPIKNTRVLDNSSYAVYGPTTAPSGVSIFNLPNVDWQNEFKTGFNAAAAIGYYFSDSWYMDLEFLYQLIRRQVVGKYNFIEYDAVNLSVIDSLSGIPIAPSSGYVNVYSLLTNGYRSFNIQSKVKPYIGGGFGIAWINGYSTTASSKFTTHLGSTAPTLQHSPKLSGTALALQLKTGVNYRFKRHLDLLLQYRLFLTSSFIANSSSIITNPNSGSSSRSFIVSEQTIHGILTNSLEIIIKFGL